MKYSRFADKQIVILGLGRQGLALARFLHAAGAHVTISDRNRADQLAEEVAALGGLEIRLILGGHPSSLLDGCELLCLSGGVPAQIEIVREAVLRGIPLTNDSLLTFQLLHDAEVSPSRIIAITGSSGKTTTTTLVGEMLRSSGIRAHVGGNIGRPLVDRLDTLEPGDVVILELSSFQLELFDPKLAREPLTEIGPDIMALLNITPNHLDRHGSMRVYTECKLNGLRTLPMGAKVVLNADDPVTAQLLPEEFRHLGEAPDQWAVTGLLDAIRHELENRTVAPVPFSRTRALSHGAWRQMDDILVNGEVICRVDEVQLRGEHNVSNLLAAMAIAGAAGATSDAMRKVATTFAGVPHRLEVVAVTGGVTWINDSIATSPEHAGRGAAQFRSGTTDNCSACRRQGQRVALGTIRRRGDLTGYDVDRIWRRRRHDRTHGARSSGADQTFGT